MRIEATCGGKKCANIGLTDRQVISGEIRSVGRSDSIGCSRSPSIRHGDSYYLFKEREIARKYNR